MSVKLTEHGLHYLLCCRNSDVKYLSSKQPRDYKTEVIKLFSCSTQLRMKFSPLINVKMPTMVGILTCMSGKSNSLGLTEPQKKAEFLDIFILMSI